MLRILIAAFAFTACSPGAIAIGPDHPAHAGAPSGRLAGPPAALAAVDENPAIEEPPRAPSEPEHQHSAPAAPASPEPKVEPTTASPEPKAEPQQPAKQPRAPKPKRPAPPKKPAPTPEPLKPTPPPEHHH